MLATSIYGQLPSRTTRLGRTNGDSDDTDENDDYDGELAHDRLWGDVPQADGGERGGAEVEGVVPWDLLDELDDAGRGEEQRDDRRDEREDARRESLCGGAGEGRGGRVGGEGKSGMGGNMKGGHLMRKCLEGS